MYFKEVINLIGTTGGENAVGDPIKTETISGDIPADKQSITRSEFYQAAAVGMKPSVTFVIRSCEYNDESLLKWNEKTYKIIRTYQKDDEFIELVCEGVAHVVTS